MGSYVFSISPRVQLHVWFHRLGLDRLFITVVSRLISNRTQVKAHLNRIEIVREAVCGCEKNYETVWYPNGCNWNHNYRKRFFLCVPEIRWLSADGVILGLVFRSCVDRLSFVNKVSIIVCVLVFVYCIFFKMNFRP
jgi:hypothetical protein